MPDAHPSDAEETSQRSSVVSELRRSSRAMAARRERPRPADDAIILYRIGPVTRAQRHDLEPLLDAFHANREIQDQCRIALRNGELYMHLQETEDGSSYRASRVVPTGTRLAVYSGFVREAKPGQTRRRHDLGIGDPGLGYHLLLDGSPGLSPEDDRRHGRLQMVDHACSPHHNCVCAEMLCEDTRTS